MAKNKKRTPKILKAWWSDKYVKLGEKVTLNALTTAAVGKTAVFQIYEYRKKNQLVKELKVPVRKPQVSVSWRAEYVPDVHGEEPPEYRFKISVDRESRTSKTLYLKAEAVTVALTFDDGPHAANKGNRTEKILNVLKERRIKVAFFIQTHAPDRASSIIGQEIVQRMAKEGHIIGIHTGSLEDHVDHAIRVKQDPEDVNGDGKVDGDNGLESDLIRAKLLIKELTGNVPEFVRAPYGRYKAHKEILPTYRRQKLIHIFWDIDSLDNVKIRGKIRSPEEVKKSLKDSFRALKSSETIVLFHDLNPFTAKELQAYINTIARAITEIKKAPKFITRRQDLRALLKRKGIK